MAEYQEKSTSVGQAAGKVGDAAGQAAGQATAAVGQAAGQMARQAQQAAAPVTAQAQETAGQVAEQAKQQALSQLGTQKDHAAGSLDAVAQALRQSGDQLRTQQQGPLADLAGMAAGRVEQLSGYLRSTDVGEMVRDVEGFARRQPAAFLGGAFTLGVLAARFLKSSARPDADQQTGGATGRRPSYPGYSTTPSAISGTGRYPVPGRYPAPGNAAGGASTSWLAPDSPTGGDPGSVDSAMPDPALRGTSSGASAGGPMAGRTAGGTASPSAGTRGAGWGSSSRSGGRTEGEGR